VTGRSLGVKSLEVRFSPRPLTPGPGDIGSYHEHLINTEFDAVNPQAPAGSDSYKAGRIYAEPVVALERGDVQCPAKYRAFHSLGEC
jgi:hypothetical protein